MKCKNCGHYIQKQFNTWYHVGWYGTLKEKHIGKDCWHGNCTCMNPEPENKQIDD